MLVLSTPFVSGFLTILSLPSFDLGFLAWFSLAPLLFALRQRGPRGATALGFLFGYVLGGGTFYWLNTIPFVTPFRFHLMVAAFSLYYLVFGLLYNLTSRAMGSWVIVGGPALWVALEYARANLGFIALPWNFLGHSQYRYLPVIQIADLTGLYGISFLVAMANQFLSQLLDLFAGRRWPWRAHAFALGLVLATTLLYGWHKLAAPEEGEHLRVALVQANLLARRHMSVKDQMAHLRTYEELTKEAAKQNPQLIVWPSSSLPGPISFWIVRLYINDVAHRAGAYLLVGGAGGDKFGAPRDGYLPYSNSEFLISPSGRLEGQYDKIHLTPFSEYIPLYGKVRWPRAITSLERSFVPGETYTLFQVSQARFGAPICWESMFPDLFRRFVLDGAQFMVNVTNEGAFGATSAPHQTLAMNVFRAVENRVTIVRAATTGVSAFIDPKGEIVARITDGNGKDLFVSGVLVWDVSLSNKRTLYTLYGDVFANASIAAFLLIVLMSGVVRRYGGGRTRPRPDRVHGPEEPEQVLVR